MKAFALAVCTLLSCAPLALHADDDISKVNRSIRVAAGETAGDVSTVNGSIHLEDGVRAEDVETVNGSVKIGRNVVVQSIETVNGGVTLGDGTQAAAVETVNGALTLAENTQISGAVGTVNGAVRLARNVQVAGDVTNVNGKISLDHAQVGGGLRTTSGDIDIGAGSRVRGGVVVEKPSFSWFSRNRAPEIVIGPGAVVEGELRFERDVELYVSDSAKIGPVTGATPISFSGAEPGREERRKGEMQVEK